MKIPTIRGKKIFQKNYCLNQKMKWCQITPHYHYKHKGANDETNSKSPMIRYDNYCFIHGF